MTKGIYWIIVILLTVLLAFAGGACTPRDAHRDLLEAVPPGAAMLGGAGAGALLRGGELPETLPSSLRRDLIAFRRAVARLDSLGVAAPAAVLFLEPAGPEGPALGAVLPWPGSGFSPGRLAPGGALRTTVYRGVTLHFLPLPEAGELVAARYGDRLLLARFAFLLEAVIGRRNQAGGAPPPLRTPPPSPWTAWLPTAWLETMWPGEKSLPPGWLRLEAAADSAGGGLRGRLLSDAPPAWLAATSPGRPGAILNVLPEDVDLLQWRHTDASARAWPPAGGEDDPLRAALLPLIGAEQAGGMTNLAAGFDRADRFWVVQLRDPEQAAGRLAGLGQSLGLLDEFDYQTYRVRRLLSGPFRAPASAGEGIVNPYIAVLDSFAVFAGSRPAIELWIDHYLAGATLARSAPFLEYYAANDTLANAWWLARTGALTRWLPPESLAAVAGAALSRTAFTGVRWGGYRDGLTPLAGAWRQAAAVRPAPPAFVWRSRLDAPAHGAPQVFRPPGLPAGITVQDRRHRLYLFDDAGRLRWSERLDGPLLGPLHLVDYYRDGRRQLLGNTADAIHLLDLATGRSIGNFPLRLQSPATNGVTLADFSGRGDYALFVACANGRIYGYDLRGVPVPGWAPQDSVGRVVHPLLHFQEGGRDFLVALTYDGALHAWRRDGSPRFPPLTLSDTFPSPPACQLHPRAARMVAAGNRGAAHVVNLDGQHFPLRLFPAPRGPVLFAFADVLGDDRFDYVALSGRTLTVHAYQGNAFRRARTFTFDQAPGDLFTVDMPGDSHTWIGAADTARRRLFLLPGEGPMHPAFPIGGYGRFALADLFGDSRRILIVADGEYLCAYDIL